MTQRTIPVGSDFMVDSPVPLHDGAGRPFYAIQMIDRDHQNRKYCMVACERTIGTLTEVLRVDAIIGAPSLVVRPDGSAYVMGGGRDNTIVTGVSIPDFVPLVDVRALAATVTRLSVQLANALERIAGLEGK